MTAINGAVRNGLEALLLERGRVIEPSPARRPDTPCQRPMLSNCSDGSSRPLPDIVQEAIALLGGWPKNVAGGLLVPDGVGGLLDLRTTSSVIAYLSGVADVRWQRGPTCPTKDEFFERLLLQAEKFDSVEYFPHDRELPRTFYYHPGLRPAQPGSLDRLLSFFSPASEVDRILLRAFACTLFWAGSAGGRPTFVFTHDGSSLDAGNDRDTGRGIAKSMTVALISSLCGGFVDCGSDIDVGTLETRLLSAGARDKRLVRMDNVKTDRLSLAGFERLTTAPVISGRKLYAGEGSRPNYLTYAITMNGVVVSEDLASRSVLIKLRRPLHYLATWQRDVQNFIETNRWAIIAEIIAILRQPSDANLHGFRRHAEWELEVLGRQPDAQLAINTVQERRGEIDGDAETVRAVLDGLRRLRVDYGPRNVRNVTTAQMLEIVREACDDRYPANKLKAFLTRMGIPGLVHRRGNQGAFYEWTDPDQPVHSPTPDVRR